MQKEKRKLKKIKKILIIVLFVVLLWSVWTYFEFEKVKKGQRPLICFKETKDVEDTDEYYKMCYGIFYKYKEYYYTKTDELTAREFTLFFAEFERDSDRK